jgi:hypothetical protein
MRNVTVREAVQVLNAVQHRGARSWQYDESLARVFPVDQDALEWPLFTAFEACAVARRLTEIGACGKGRETGYAQANRQ